MTAAHKGTEEGSETCSAKPAEVYGFVGWIVTMVGYALFFLWAYLPDSALADLGITYYPSKYWAVGIPCWICMLIVATYQIYEALNMMSTPNPASLSTVTDPHAHIRDLTNDDSGSIKALSDIPITTMCRILYSDSSHGE